MVRTEERVDGPAVRSRRGRPRRLVREFWSWPTLLVMSLSVCAGVPLAVLLTPDQEVQVLGQSIAVGGRDPQLNWSGPAQVVQVGNTEFDLPKLTVYGPVRPRLSLGPVQRNEYAAQALNPGTAAGAQSDALSGLIDGFVRWYLWGAVGVVAFAIAASGLVGCLRMLVVLRREDRPGREHIPIAQLWQGLSGAVGRMTLLAVSASLLAWAVSGGLAYIGTTRGLATVTSLSDLVGRTQVTPAPVGPEVYGYAGAVIGDSRVARLGGPPVVDATEEDRACRRSADSLAAELTLMQPARVLSLACSGASVALGLRGPQQVGDQQVPAQVGRLKQVQGLRFVVVAIGPNDMNWSDFLQYCYGLTTCDDKLTDGEFGFRIAAFDQDFAALLQDLNDLPDHPEVIIMTSYDAFAPEVGADCLDVSGPDGVAGLNQHKVDLLHDRNAQLNAVLVAGAEKYGFTLARPQLTLLCGTDDDGLGPDLQGLADPDPFHPTGVGSLRLAATVAQLVD